MPQDESWFHPLPAPGPAAHEAASAHLVCFPGVGGNIIPFRDWPSRLPAGTEVLPVQLPGRGPRWSEDPVREIPALARPVTDALLRKTAGPLVLFGFSFGGLLGYEVTRRLAAAGRPPAHFVVAASRAPHMRDDSTFMHPLDDGEFAAAIREMGATPDEVLDHPELRELVLPALRADCEAGETYRPPDGDVSDVPLTAIGAEDDLYLTPGEVAEWQRWTSSSFDMRVVTGGHFVLEGPAEQAVLGILAGLATGAGRPDKASPGVPSGALPGTEADTEVRR